MFHRWDWYRENFAAEQKIRCVTMSRLVWLERESYIRGIVGKKAGKVQFSSVQLLSCVRLSVTPWIAAHQASLPITISRSSLKLTSIELVMPSSHLILCCPLFLLLPIPPSIRVFSNELTLRMRWPKYWSFSFSIIRSKEHPGLISFRMDWLDLLAVRGTLKSLLQHRSSKASILQRSAFFTVQLSHPYMTTGKTIALTRRTFVGKVMSLLFNLCYVGWYSGVYKGLWKAKNFGLHPLKKWYSFFFFFFFENMLKTMSFHSPENSVNVLKSVQVISSSLAPVANPQIQD